MEKDIFELRSSVRKFSDEPVPDSDIEKMLQAAVLAPSGKNMQNWHFVIVKNKAKIEELADIIAKKNKDLRDAVDDGELKENFKRYLKYGTFFKDAPVLVLFFHAPYPVTGRNIMEAAASPKEEIEALLKADPGIQNIAAAAENFMLKAAELGYGTCWMTSQNYAALEIKASLEADFDKNIFDLALITPLGVPASEVSSPTRKALAEVTSWIK
ncbi:nitroreductase family protein [Halanaerobium sp. Z-7514]|uniref:Nitroreductase family protein n=1 Tax=Halanaerobium polyolivorans TaxID=2886943 RepID=A0AAW4WZF2_9FIRM|nr:nitroreductase family protein [Halanaerobium polyolivorans]MCC3144855.1 nitroreductase family protein [Halanaerobium polyolivorans]